MCVVNSVYVYLKYNEISVTFTAGYVCMSCVCNSCGRSWSVCVVVLVPYLVVAVTVMRVLLDDLCEGYDNAGVGVVEV